MLRRRVAVYFPSHPITLPLMSEAYIVPPCRETVDILFADEHLLFVRKPHLLLSIPGRHPANHDCVISRLRRDFPGASIVHRLDLDTSGVMVIPLSPEVHSHISRQFQQRRVKKEYHAVVFGEVTANEGEIDLPIAPDWSNRPRQKICWERGKPSLTRYRVIDRSGGCSRLSATLNSTPCRARDGTLTPAQDTSCGNRPPHTRLRSVRPRGRPVRRTPPVAARELPGL